MKEQQAAVTSSIMQAMRSAAGTPVPSAHLDYQAQQASILQLLQQGQLNEAFQQVGYWWLHRHTHTHICVIFLIFLKSACIMLLWACFLVFKWLLGNHWLDKLLSIGLLTLLHVKPHYLIIKMYINVIKNFNIWARIIHFMFSHINYYLYWKTSESYEIAK